MPGLAVAHIRHAAAGAVPDSAQPWNPVSAKLVGRSPRRIPTAQAREIRLARGRRMPPKHAEDRLWWVFRTRAARARRKWSSLWPATFAIRRINEPFCSLPPPLISHAIRNEPPFRGMQCAIMPRDVRESAEAETRWQLDVENTHRTGSALSFQLSLNVDTVKSSSTERPRRHVPQQTHQDDCSTPGPLICWVKIKVNTHASRTRLDSRPEVSQ